MSSDVVRWSVVSSDNQPPTNMLQSQNNGNNCQRRHQNHKQSEYIDANTIAAFKKPQSISKLILLTVWLVIVQHLNVVLSEPILDTKNLNQRNHKIITDNNLMTKKNNSIVNANKLSDDVPMPAKSMNDVDDLISEYQNHQIHVDDDIINDKHYTSTWAAHIPGGIHIADQVAKDHGFVNLGQIFDDHYHFHHKEIQKRSVNPSHHHQNRLTSDDRVHWSKQQRIKSRQKRDFQSFHNPDYPLFATGKNRVATTDPKWPQMWYLHRGNGLDMNVIPAWKEGVTGKGIVVTILDDGLESDHPDLLDSFDPKASYDVNSHDDDPMPHYDMDDSNRHGTRCAGEVAATFNNSLCCTGIAYGASVGGVRMLDGDVTDAVEARSLSLNPQHIDIYSASWGPDDDGKTVDGPGELATRAFIEGVTKGRSGKGSIFIWASGNGGKDHDNCNCDGYTNSIWTLSISSATERGLVPWYSEKCSSTLATTYSSGSKEERQVVTTDLHHSCTTSHTGTSASAPLAAGIAALVLEANRNLTWRDLQHIVVRTAKPANLQDSSWSKNGVGRRVSHSFGYGLMDAMAMIKLARTWKTVPEQQRCEIYAPSLDKTIAPKSYIVISLKIAKHQCESVNFLEHVQAKITLTTQRRGDIQIHLTSPAGTKVTLLTSRSHDNSRSGFNQWPFMSVHTWGESPHGQWLLEIRNDGRYMAQVTQWGLIMHGTDAPAQQNDPQNFNAPVDPDFFGHIDQNSLDFDAQTSGQWRHMQQVGESHVDVQRTAASNDQTDSACIKSSPDKYCIVCEQTTFIYKGRCYTICPDRAYMVAERPPRAVVPTIPQKKCADCHESCNRCRGPNAYECTECLNESTYREVSSNETYCDVSETAPPNDVNGELKVIKMDHILNETENRTNLSHKSFSQLFYDHFSLFMLCVYVIAVLIALICIRMTFIRISTKDNHSIGGNDNKKNYAYNRITYDGTNDHILMEQALVNNNSTSDSSDEIDIEIIENTGSQIV